MDDEAWMAAIALQEGATQEPAPEDIAAPGDELLSAAALAIRRGTRRLLLSMGAATLVEMPLVLPGLPPRRADIVALFPDGRLSIVEVKSGLPDFLADRKWPDYLHAADSLYFAVDADFPLERLPDEAGIIVADGYGAAILRPAAEDRLPAPRRKALTLRLALIALQRLHRLEDAQAFRDPHRL